MTAYINWDGLEKRFGTDQAKKALIGEYEHDGALHCAEIDFSYTDLPAVASNSVVIDESFILPKGAIVEKVSIFCDVDMDSTSDDMTLNVGWVNLDRTNGIDVDAFVVAATQTELNSVGPNDNVAGWVGAEVGGAKTTVPKLLTWEVDNHAASAGHGVIRLFYSAH